MVIEIRVPSIVVLVGVSGTGKSTFAAKWFAPTEILSSDRCRALVSDDENDQSATQEAFNLLMHLARLRLKRGKLCVFDATNTTSCERLKFIRLANEHGCGVSAIVFRTALATCLERTRMRRDRDIQEPSVVRQYCALMADLPALRLEGFAPVWSLMEDVSAPGVEVRRA
jgi:protein phosphatase